ncbi:zinc finger, CCHC-type containing protein [Tanacetum coccineum]
MVKPCGSLVPHLLGFDLIKDKLNYLEHPIPATPVPTQAGQQVAAKALAAHAAWMLPELKTLFAQQAEQELLQTMQEFHSCKQVEGQSVSSYILKIKCYIDNLEHLGHPVTTGLGDGIFEIDLSDSYTNVNYIYALSNKRSKSNLDSALLWHCRLGHISKKRIEKLQHDGLLNSTSLRDFENAFLDNRIITYRTPPYTPQHNGVSERRNRTLIDIVRSMMSQTTLPKSFWDYALETAARILNMVPTKKVKKTPYKVWHGQAPKMSYLKVWGCV